MKHLSGEEGILASCQAVADSQALVDDGRHLLNVCLDLRLAHPLAQQCGYRRARSARQTQDLERLPGDCNAEGHIEQHRICQ